MLAKTILVVLLITGRAQVEVQYIVRFPTEAACQAEAKKYIRSGWASYPIREAACVFDATGPQVTK